MNMLMRKVTRALSIHHAISLCPNGHGGISDHAYCCSLMAMKYCLITVAFLCGFKLFMSMAYHSKDVTLVDKTLG